MRRDEKEVFIDGGGFDGDTLEAFLGEYETFRLYLFFEPETAPFEAAKAKFSDSRIEYHNMGLYVQNEKVSFNSDGRGMGEITRKKGDTTINTLRLDDAAPDGVTFIKLDVEGAEMEALHGAEMIIKTRSPKIAVSVYHEPEDIIELSSYLRKLVPEYKFYLRCAFESLYNDVVLFAV